MIDKNRIIVLKNDVRILIFYNGCKLIKPIAGFEHMSTDKIKAMFMDELLVIGGEN